MNSFNNFFFLIPFLIVAFAAIVIVNSQESQEIVKPNEIKQGEKEKPPHLTVEIAPQAKSHGLPVRSPQESPSKDWKKPPTSPTSPRHAGKRGNGAEAGSPKKYSPNGRKPMTFREIPTIPDMMKSTDALKSVPENEEIVTDDFVGGFHHVPTLDTVVHEVNKHDAMLKSHQDQIGAVHRSATNVKKTMEKYQEANEAEHSALRNYSHKINKGLGDTQQKMAKFYDEYGQTADSHNALKENYDKFVLTDKEIKNDIHSKLDTHGTGIETLQKDLGTERGRINSAERKHGELKTAHDELSTHVKNVVGKQLYSHEDKLRKNGEKMDKMIEKDDQLGEEIGKVDKLRQEFEEKTFAEHVKGTNEKFTKAYERMNGFETKATELSATQEMHGQDIQGLKGDVNDHKGVLENLRTKNKTRKQENIDLLTKQMELLKHQNDVHEKSQAIINHVWDYGLELPQIFAKQSDINRAYQALLNAKEMATKVGEENKKKVQEAENELEEEKQKVRLAADAIEMEAVHKELLEKDELEKERVKKEGESKNKIWEEKQVKLRELFSKDTEKQNEILAKKELIESDTVIQAKKHAENVEAANVVLSKAIIGFEETLKEYVDEENKKKRIQAFEELKGSHKEMIDTKMKVLNEDEKQREEARKQRKIERDARRAEAAKMAAPAK